MFSKPVLVKVESFQIGTVVEGNEVDPGVEVDCRPRRLLGGAEIEDSPLWMARTLGINLDGRPQDPRARREELERRVVPTLPSPD